MSLNIEDPLEWTPPSLCKHYYHFASQKVLWTEAMLSGEPRRSVSVKLSDVAALSAAITAAAHGGSFGGSSRRLSLESVGRRMSAQDSEARKSLIRSQNIIIEEEETAPGMAGAGPLTFEISPLKELLLAKKPDLGKIKDLLEEMRPDELTKWLNVTLDATPPPMPAPLFHAVAAAQWDVVSLLVEFRVDVLAQYEGKSLLKGWIRPNTPLVECVNGRKGRFVGTMLGDKLEAVEVLLKQAAKRQRALEREASGEGGPADMASIPSEATPQLLLRQRTKSVQLKSIRGLMLHTQGHPNMTFELDAGFDGASMSSVRAAIQIESGLPFAIKAGSKYAEDGSNDNEGQLWNEIVTLRKLEHPNIIKLHETFEDEHNIFMVFEFCKGGELFDHIVHSGNFPEHTTMRLAYQMGAAIQHLHQLRICHRDIRPEAFIVADAVPLDETTVKLIDFNTSKDMSTGPLTTKICTLHYVAPEVLTSSEGYTEKVDVWSLGVVIYVMAAGVPPFDAENELDVLQAVKAGEFTFEPEPIWADISQGTQDLITTMLTHNPDKRPDMFAAMEHPRLKLAETEGALISPEPGASSGCRSSTCEASEIRNAFTTFVEHIDDVQLMELRKLFKDIDRAQTGVVNIADCTQRLAEMFPGNADIKGLCDRFEVGSVLGKINYAMFLATMTDKRRQLRREAARMVFNAFDIDKNGNISVYEIAQALGRGEELREGRFPNIPIRDLRAVWDEMKEVFSAQEFSDRELTFEDFFKQLPKANLGILV